MRLSHEKSVDRFRYTNGVDGSDVTFYRVNNGGHTWPGAIPIPAFGFTNEDINASAIIWEFFRDRCTMVTSITERTETSTFTLSPNPACDQVRMDIPQHMNAEVIDLSLIDEQGSVLLTKRSIGNTVEINIASLAAGLYIVRLANNAWIAQQKLVIARDR